MDLPQDWPEPVVSVQSLAESGMTTIPDCYVKPPSQQPSKDTTELPGDINIPIIDLAEGAPYSPATVAAISEACREWGFFQVVNHGVKPELMKAVREAWRGFFHLPLEEKQKYANNPRNYVGYGSRIGVGKAAVHDWRDFFNLGTIFPESNRDLAKWPNNPATLREICDEYGRQAVGLCEKLLKVLSMGLGLEEGSLQKAFGGKEADAILHINLYPKCPQPDLTLGLFSHSDHGGFTILLPDDRVSGLQVLKGNSWITVQPAPDAFIVNIGDQIQILSNATYKAVQHRVITNSAEERISIPLFYNPKGDLPIGPIHELVTLDRPPIYKTITFNEYQLHMMTRGIDEKSHVESLEIKPVI